MKPLLLLPLSALYICSLTDNVFDVNKDGVVNSADVASFYNLVISGKDCSLIWGGACLSSRIWMFGDSYFALDNPARWTYWLPQDKQNLILFNAFSGAKSKAIIEDFENLLQVAKPEMAVWCLGMNDKDNSTSKYSTTPNPSWLNATEKFLALCRQHGITPVLTTIPLIPQHFDLTLFISS